MLDQSPLGVDAAHKGVVLQHFLQTWKKAESKITEKFRGESERRKVLFVELLMKN